METTTIILQHFFVSFVSPFKIAIALKHNRNSHFAKSEFSGGVGLKKRASFKIAWCNEMSSCYYPIIREAPSTKKRSSFLLKQLSYCILVSLHSDLKLSKKSHLNTIWKMRLVESFSITVCKKVIVYFFRCLTAGGPTGKKKAPNWIWETPNVPIQANTLV